MDIKDLPGPGINFRAKTGVGNFQKKLKLMTRYGKYRNLQDNIPEIVKVVKQNERTIKIKGGFSRLAKREAWYKIKRSTPSPTRADKYEIKEIINHLGRGAAAKEAQKLPKDGEDGKEIEVEGKKKFVSFEELKRRTKGTMERDESGLESKYHRPNIRVMGQAGGTSTGTAGSPFARPGQPSATGLSRLVQSGQPAPGFANKINNASVSIVRTVQEKKPLNNTQSYNSLKGERPIELKI